MKKTYCAIIMAGLLLPACKEGGERTTEEISYQGDSVIVNPDSPVLQKITTLKLEKELFSNEFRTVGTARAETEHYSEVGVPFDGRITKARVMLGSRVRAGQTLFEVSSPEFFEASKTYFQNKRNYETAKSAYERKKELQKSGIVSLRELEEALTELENSRQEKAASEAAFVAYGMNPGTIEPGQAMHIVAPISGEVVRCNITPGEYTRSDGDALVIIADLDRIWITAQVKERFIGLVTEGGRVEIFTEAEPDVPIQGRVLNVGNMVDGQTRSVQVIVACDNPERKLKHGMYVSVHFISEPENAIVVPSTSLFQGESSSYVYLVTDESNVFLRHPVTVGAADDSNSRVQVIKGLEEGDIIVSEGGLYLNN